MPRFVAWMMAAVAVVSAPLGAAIDTKRAPEVTVQDATGAPVPLLGNYKGHVVLVDFWASWCVSCKASFPALDKLAHELEPSGVVVLAVNVDEQRRDADAFLKAHPATMTVLFDPKGAAPAAFGVKGMPTSFVIDRAGMIRFTHMGYTGSVADEYRTEIARLLAER